MTATSVTALSRSGSNEGNEFAKLPWITAPESGQIADKATIKLDEKTLFLGESGTSKFLELMGNPARPGHFTIAPKDETWFAVFNFDADGYVKDDETIDADELLKSLKSGDQPANEERKRLGLKALYTDGWSVPPHYDPTTNRLEWGVRLSTEEGAQIVNYTSRILGRSGVMNATLVSQPETLDADRASFAKALSGFDYKSGERYSEWRAGDKVAAYGLRPAWARVCSRRSRSAPSPCLRGSQVSSNAYSAARRTSGLSQSIRKCHARRRSRLLACSPCSFAPATRRGAAFAHLGSRGHVLPSRIDCDRPLNCSRHRVRPHTRFLSVALDAGVRHLSG